MQAFSKSLVELYDAAIYTDICDYPQQMLKIIKQLIDFDGAVLGTGRVRTMQPPDLIIEQAHVINRDIAILDDYAHVSAKDAVTHMFTRGLDCPLALDCEAFYAAKQDSAMRHFVQHHAINHLLLFGSKPDQERDAQWLVLYRGAGKPFEQKDKAYLIALWPHLLRAIGINFTNCLSSHLIQQSDSAAALINRTGSVEVATTCFRKMLTMEWPDWQDREQNKLPDQMIQACMAATSYAGSVVNFVMNRQGDYVVCVATRRSKLMVLTPTENFVLLRFASGLSHKKIAQITGSSQNTIRSHIAHGYAKLGIHNKASLANLFSLTYNAS